MRRAAHQLLKDQKARKEEEPRDQIKHRKIRPGKSETEEGNIKGISTRTEQSTRLNEQCCCRCTTLGEKESKGKFAREHQIFTVLFRRQPSIPSARMAQMRSSKRYKPGD